MKEFLAVLSYTFKENMRKKVFIISTIIVILFTVIIVCLPGAIKVINGDGKNIKSSSRNAGSQAKTGNILVIDSKRLYTNDMAEIEKIFSSYSFKVENASDIEGLKDRVTKEDNTSLIVIDEKNGVPVLDYFVKTYGRGLSPDEISSVFKRIHANKVLKAAGVSEQISSLVQSDVYCSVKELGKGMMKSYMASIIISILLFFAIYFFGYGVSMSVASEKTSRVMEILVTSTKPLKIVLGKSVAMGLLGLCQLASVIIAAIAAYKLTFPEDFTIAGQRIDFSGFSPFVIGMIITYFILGYSLFAMLNAAAGATVSKAEDINSAIMPVSMILMVSFYFAYFTLMFPTGTVATAASMIPFSAPFSMPCRLLASEVPAWQLAVSLFAMVVTIVLIAWFSIKIYSSAVLHYGKRLKIKDIMKMSKLNV
jgi:ABC-2 type transport system permease protein